MNEQLLSKEAQAKALDIFKKMYLMKKGDILKVVFGGNSFAVIKVNEE